MKRTSHPIILTLLLLTSEVQAQTNASDEPNRWQVTPFIGYSSQMDFDDQNDSGSPSARSSSLFGLAFGKETSDPGLVEVIFSHQNTSLSPDIGEDLNISYLHFAGALVYPEGIRPYIGAGMGIGHFSAYDSTTRPSLALAVGIQPYISNWMSLRAEIRGYGTFVSDNSEFICDPRQCNLRLQGEMVTQAQANLGLTFRF